jgi:hypothetical protein
MLGDDAAVPTSGVISSDKFVYNIDIKQHELDATELDVLFKKSADGFSFPDFGQF